MATLNELRDEALRIAVEHGFTDASVGEDLMLMVTEIAEAMEDHRAGKKPDEIWYEKRTGGGLRASGALFEAAGNVVGNVTIETVRIERYDVPRDPRGAGPLLKPCGIPSELADVVIRVLHFCGKHNIDLEKAVREKMAYNESRPLKHGGKVL